MKAECKPLMVVELRVRTVILELTCEDHYAAIELYEALVSEARRAGKVELVVGEMRARQERGFNG